MNENFSKSVQNMNERKELEAYIAKLEKELKAAMEVISACENLLDLIVYYDDGSIELNGSCLFSLKEALQKHNDVIK